jgi:hypothetical protein
MRNLRNAITDRITVSLRLDTLIAYDIRDICQSTLLEEPRGALCGVSGVRCSYSPYLYGDLGGWHIYKGGEMC